MRSPMPFLIVVLCLGLSGCDAPSSVTPSASPSPSAPAAQGRAAVDSAIAIPPASGGSLFLHGPGAAAVVEHPAAALPFWRDQREERPTLLLVANDPFLERIPETLATAAGELLEKGGAEEIVLKSSPQSPDPLLLPSMTVRAALKAGWFGKVVWLLPNRAEQEELSADTFRQQLLDFGAANETEAGSFVQAEGQLLGTIEGIPWLVTPVHLFAGTPEPVVIHFDLGLIKSFYRNEVKTPLFPTLAELLEPLRRARLTALAVTVSLSQLTGEVPLDTRFIGFDLATFVAEPQRFEAPLAESWRRRSDALYLQNFFQKEKILALYLEMAAAEPENASVDFGLYQIGRQMKNDEQALAYLDAAVKNDPVYAVEYLELAQQTLHQQRFEPALELMAKAAAALPDNPFIALQRARLLLAQGRKGEALALFQGLRRLPWSPVYYPDLPAQLDAEIDQARQKD